jgi:hypothetical protein
LTNPNEPLQIDCPLIASEQPIGVGVPPKGWVRFTNNTSDYLQVDEVTAVTGETAIWGEFCAYIDHWLVGQDAPGFGEVGCTSKNVGELYPPVRFGAGTGLSVAPGSIFQASANTAPTGTNHTFSLRVRKQVSGLHSWRQPQLDEVIRCNGMSQSTKWGAWQNTTGRDLHLTSAEVYAVSGSSATPDTIGGPACIYTFRANGAPKWSNCDAALRTRGPVAFQMQVVEAGEWVAAQAVNACAAPAVWDWAAFLHIW